MIILKKCIKIPKNTILCVRVVADQPCNASGPPAQVQNAVATPLSLGDTTEFLQAKVFFLSETLA